MRLDEPGSDSEEGAGGMDAFPRRFECRPPLPCVNEMVVLRRMLPSDPDNPDASAGRLGCRRSPTMGCVPLLQRTLALTWRVWIVVPVWYVTFVVPPFEGLSGCLLIAGE